jgi:hypothetical protein
LCFNFRTLKAKTFQFSVLTALCAIEPALARHSKSKLFLCPRLLAAFTLICREDTSKKLNNTPAKLYLFTKEGIF